MGLPRYLNDKYRNLTQDEKEIFIFLGSSRLPYESKKCIFQKLKVFNTDCIIKYGLQCFYQEIKFIPNGEENNKLPTIGYKLGSQWGFREIDYYYNIKVLIESTEKSNIKNVKIGERWDSFGKIDVYKNVIFECKTLKINYLSHNTWLAISELNDLNIAKAYANFDKIKKFKNKIFNQRAFTATLRHLIFERDNYSCKICGKHKDHLEKDNHLEVDHIHEWSDGGQTTYDNGQTVCAKCNKGKHHAKKYLECVV